MAVGGKAIPATFPVNPELAGGNVDHACQPVASGSASYRSPGARHHSHLCDRIITLLGGVALQVIGVGLLVSTAYGLVSPGA